MITFAAHWPAIQAGTIWDDSQFVTENRTLREPGGLGRIWFEPEASPHFYPLLLTTWWVEYRVTGLDLAVSHGINVLLHALCALTLWRVLKRLDLAGAFFAAALFAVHPVTVESVAWLTERKNTLSMVLFLLSTLWYLRFEDGSEDPARSDSAQRIVMSFGSLASYLSALCLFTLALLSKTAVATMPLLLLLLAWWRRGRVTRADLIRVAPFLIVAALLGLVTLSHEHRFSIATTEPRPEDLWSRLAATGWCVWFYLFKLALPVGLSMVYLRWDVTAASAVSWLPLLGLFSVGMASWWWRPAWGRPVLAALGAYVVMLLPALGLVDVAYFKHSLVADHFQYFAMMAPLCLAVALVVRLLGLLVPTLARRLSGVVVAAGILAVLSTMTWQRSRLYVHPAQLWLDTVRKNPSSAVAHYSLGGALRSAGRVAAAINHFERALQIKPDYAKAHNNLGVALAAQDRLEEAVDHYHSAVRISPGFAEAYYNLGVALASQGRTVKAIDRYRAALHINPEYAGAHNNLAIALGSQGRLDDAINHLRLALSIDPDFIEAHINMGFALASLGRLDRAMNHYLRAVAGRPGDARAHHGLATVLARQGRLDEAVHHLGEALRNDPRLTAARTDLDAILDKMKRAGP